MNDQDKRIAILEAEVERLKLINLKRFVNPPSCGIELSECPSYSYGKCTRKCCEYQK